MSGYSQPIILNVDDNEIGRYAVTKTLEKAGFRVIETATGKDAIKRAPQCELVVLDVNLPDISGFEVCRRLKSDPTTSRIPFCIYQRLTWTLIPPNRVWREAQKHT